MELFDPLVDFGHPFDQDLPGFILDVDQSVIAILAVEAAFVPDERTQADFGRRAGTSLVPVAAWRWDRCERAAYAQATDLRQGEFAPSVSTTVNAAARLFRWAAALAAVAIVVHVLATIGEWTSLRVEGWRVRSALSFSW